MSLRFLLDTHVLIRWLVMPKKLSAEQTRILRDAARRCEPFGVSAITLVEIATLADLPRARKEVPAGKLFAEVEESPTVQIVPMTIPIALEIAAMGSALRDPMDRAIVATARVMGLRLLTSDQRIIESNLVTTVE